MTRRSWSAWVGRGGMRRRLPAALMSLAVPAVLAAACGTAASGPAAPEREASTLPSPVAVAAPAGWKFADSGAEPFLEPSRSTGGMVATDARLATRVGVQELRAGGNAVDAAVATAFALAVVYPVAGNLGGGGFMVVRTAGGEAAALDFRERAPLAATRDMYLDADGQVTRDSVVGHRASGVPGSVAGLWAAHERFGSRPWSEVLAPAIDLAEEGFEVDADFADGADDARFADFPASRALFWPGGTPVAEGDRWRNPDLAAVLRRIAESGPTGFYQGETADLIVAEMEQGGGLITHQDLAQYEARWREPVAFGYRGWEVLSMPPPSSGGLTLALIANVLGGYDLRAEGWHTPEAMHLVAETFRRAYAYRNAWSGDPDFIDIPSDRFLSAEFAAGLRATIDPARATPSSEIDPGLGADGSEAMHTTHFSVVDAAGNAVALTTTINHGNGSAVTVAGAGFLLNNEMDDFASKPGTPNAFGLVQGEANAIGPGRRMVSSMTPTIVARDGQAVLVTGASGGPTITTGVFQVLSNVLDYGLDIGQAVTLPRLHHQHLPDMILYEDGGFAAADLEVLRGLGHELRPARFGIAVAASLLRAGGGWTGVHDPRAQGLAAGQ